MVYLIIMYFILWILSCIVFKQSLISSGNKDPWLYKDKLFCLMMILITILNIILVLMI
jgi:magnesium-transporting ATPase (P-type)